jgi:integrase
MEENRVVRTPTQPLNDVRRIWEKTLEDAKLPKFALYNLRYFHASRLSAAGVSDLFVAQMIGHSSPSILQIYSKAIDEYLFGVSVYIVSGLHLPINCCRKAGLREKQIP